MRCRILLAQQYSHGRQCLHVRRSGLTKKEEFRQVYKYEKSTTNHPIQPHKMSCSPTPNSHSASPEPLNNFDDISSFETQCDCQNQLAHYDWNGVPLEDLPELCKRSMGIINIDNAPTSHREGELISDGLQGRN
jgi:hypothetical protein